jgi:hypothetical protein
MTRTDTLTITLPNERDRDDAVFGAPPAGVEPHSAELMQRWPLGPDGWSMPLRDGPARGRGTAWRRDKDGTETARHS